MLRTTGTDWRGSYLSEEAIVAEMTARIKAVPYALAIWRDPESWKFHYGNATPPNAGALVFAGMYVRNYYGLWHSECPLTFKGAGTFVSENGVVTDPRHPDNVSARIIDKVKSELSQ